MRTILFLGLSILGLGSATASEPLGPMYPVIEPDLLEILIQHAREESENVQKRLEDSKKQLEAWADRPVGLRLPQTQEERTWMIRPQLTDLTPLAGFERHWLFIDGDQALQVDYAKRFMSGHTVATHRVILVSGSVKATQNALKGRVWFDQRARLVEKLGIRAVPCVVKMTAESILLKEVRP